MEKEERNIVIERTLDGVVLRIVKNGKDVVEPLVIPFTEAIKLGRILITTAKAGATQIELLVRKLAELEHEIRKLDDKLRDLTKRVETIEENMKKLAATT